MSIQQAAGPPPSSARAYNPAVLQWVIAEPVNLRAQVTTWDAAAWEAARWSIQVHGIAPLLHVASQTWPDADALDPGLRAYLATQARQSRERVTLLLGELAEILAACHAVSIPVMPLKGSLLNTRYYPAPGLRPMNDLDLLIWPADEPRVLKVLAGLGYAPVFSNWKHQTLARPSAYGPTVAWDGDHPANPRSLDLHTRLLELAWGIHYDATVELWHESEPGALLGTEAQIQRPVALLTHLLLHASTNAFARQLRLIQLYDIVRVAREIESDGWSTIVSAARARSEERLIWLPLVLTNRFWPVIPGQVMHDIAAGVPPALRRFVDAHELDQWSACNPIPGQLEERICWLRPGPEYVVAFWHALQCNPREVARRYPGLARRGLLPLAYLRYEYDMLSRFGSGLLRISWRRLRRRSHITR